MYYISPTDVVAVMMATTLKPVKLSDAEKLIDFIHQKAIDKGMKIMIVHGRNNILTNIRCSYDLFNIYKQANDVIFMPIQDSNFEYPLSKRLKYLVSKVKEFLDKTIIEYIDLYERVV